MALAVAAALFPLCCKAGIGIHDGGADADEGDAGAASMVQQLDELMQHDSDGGDAHPVLEPGRNTSVTLRWSLCVPCGALLSGRKEDELQNVVKNYDYVGKVCMMLLNG